jgi:hypothetical protein
LTVTLGKANVAVAVMVGDNSIVGVDVFVGLEVAVRVRVTVGSGVSVKACVVAVVAGAVSVTCACVDGAQAAINKKINKMILWNFM